jgi:predicted PolB exonuclease-like 3'-5' exonuclease
VAGFDLRYMVQRSIVNNVRPHRIIAAAAQAKPWESDKVFDTMVQWAGIGNRIALDKLCRALSVPTPKTGITGAQVWDEVKAGRIRDVAAYCKKDVIATREVHRRLTFQTVAPVLEFEDCA